MDVFETAKELFREHLEMDNDAFLNELAGDADYVEVPKGTVLFREGEPIRDCYALLEGLMRWSYVLDGEEITEALICDRGTVVYPSFFLRSDAPANASVLTLTDCKLLHIPAGVLLEMKRRYPEFAEAHLFLVERFTERVAKFRRAIMPLSPTKRYQYFAEKRPYLAENVPQKYIASFLGMTPVSLSRIRSRIKEMEAENKQ